MKKRLRAMLLGLFILAAFILPACGGKGGAPDAVLAAAKTAVEGLAYGPVAQALINTEASAEEYVDNLILNLELDITDEVYCEVRTASFKAAVAGNYIAVAGTNGSYKFTVELTRDTKSVETGELTLVITATAVEQDEADVQNAKAAIESADFNTTQAQVDTITKARNAVNAVLASLALNGAQPKINDVGGTGTAFTAAVGGTSVSTAGTDGAYAFTVTLAKGGFSLTTAVKTLVITASPYDPAQDTLDIAAAKAAIESAFPCYAPASVTTVALARAEAAAIVAELNLRGATPQVADDMSGGSAFTAAVAGTLANLLGTEGTYKFTVGITKGGGTPLSTVSLTLKIEAAARVKVEFNPNGGSTTPGAILAEPGKAYTSAGIGTLPAGAGSISNYTFDGWYTSAEGGSKVEGTTPVTQTANHTLFAHWKRDENFYDFTVPADAAKFSDGINTKISSDIVNSPISLNGTAYAGKKWLKFTTDDWDTWIIFKNQFIGYNGSSGGDTIEFTVYFRTKGADTELTEVTSGYNYIEYNVMGGYQDWYNLDYIFNGEGLVTPGKVTYTAGGDNNTKYNPQLAILAKAGVTAYDVYITDFKFIRGTD